MMMEWEIGLKRVRAEAPSSGQMIVDVKQAKIPKPLCLWGLLTIWVMIFGLCNAKLKFQYTFNNTPGFFIHCIVHLLYINI